MRKMSVPAVHEIRTHIHLYTVLTNCTYHISPRSPGTRFSRTLKTTHYLEKTSVLKERISNPFVPQTYFTHSLPQTLLIAWDVPFQEDAMHIQNEELLFLLIQVILTSGTLQENHFIKVNHLIH